MPRKIPSRIAKKLIAKVTGFAVSDGGCGLKVYRAAGRCTCWPMTAESSMPGVDRHELQIAAPGKRGRQGCHGMRPSCHETLSPVDGGLFNAMFLQ